MPAFRSSSRWWIATLLAAGCGGKAPVAKVERPSAPAIAPGDEAPVALDANTPAVYPASLLEAGIEGTVVVRLFVDARGVIVADSIRIAESSGYPALDSAALAAAPKLHYAPALHQGKPFAAPFLQPFQFRRPVRSGAIP